MSTQGNIGTSNIFNLLRVNIKGKYGELEKNKMVSGSLRKESIHRRHYSQSCYLI